MAKTKKQQAEDKKGGKFAISDVEYTPVDRLQPFHKNPRVGDVEAVAESLDENGQFKPIVVNRGGKTERKDEILAGNHTWLAARKLGWDTIATVYVDVDDEGASRIVLADNRTNDLAGYDDAILGDLLEDLPTLTGTGYDDVAVAELLASLPDDLEVVDIDGLGLSKHKVLPDNPDEVKTEVGTIDPEDLDEDEEVPEAPRPGRVTTKPPKEEQAEASSIDAQPEELPGMVKVADDNVVFELEQTPWDIPPLIPALIPELPANIDCWAGPAICEDDGMGHWLYNYSSDSTRGLPWERTILGFYVYDDRFENWWQHPAKMVSRTLNSGCNTAIMPDFSIIADNPRAEQMYQTYRAYWLARFMQECGMYVIPNLITPTRSEDLEWMLAPLPDSPASMSLQLQTITAGKYTDASTAKRSIRLIREVLDYVQPESLLVYTSEAGEKALDLIKPEMRTVIVPTRRRRWQQSKETWLEEKMDEEREKHGGKVMNAAKTVTRGKGPTSTGEDSNVRKSARPRR